MEAASYRHGLGLSKTEISNYSPTKQVDLWTLPLQQDFNFALHSWGSGMDRWLFSVLFCNTLAGKNSFAPKLIWVCCLLPVFVRSWAPRGWMNLAIPKSVSPEGCSRRNTKGCPLNRSRLGFWRILSFVLSVRAFPTAWMISSCFSAKFHEACSGTSLQDVYNSNARQLVSKFGMKQAQKEEDVGMPWWCRTRFSEILLNRYGILASLAQAAEASRINCSVASLHSCQTHHVEEASARERWSGK